jgi:acetyl-CoA carboxylase carboxyltransferase component
LQTKRKSLVFVQDVTGFMVGSKSEHGGIKDGAKWLMQFLIRSAKIHGNCG